MRMRAPFATKLERKVRDIMPVHGQAADEAVREVRETSSFLHETGRVGDPDPGRVV